MASHPCCAMPDLGREGGCVTLSGYVSSPMTWSGHSALLLFPAGSGQGTLRLVLVRVLPLLVKSGWGIHPISGQDQDWMYSSYFQTGLGRNLPSSPPVWTDVQTPLSSMSWMLVFVLTSLNSRRTSWVRWMWVFLLTSLNSRWTSWMRWMWVFTLTSLNSSQTSWMRWMWVFYWPHWTLGEPPGWGGCGCFTGLIEL